MSTTSFASDIMPPVRSPGTVAAEPSGDVITLADKDNPHTRPRKLSQVAADIIAKHSDVFSNEAVSAIENTPGFVEVNDFRNDLRSFAGMFILSTVVFYFMMAWYYHARLKWTWTNSLYFSVITFTTCGYGDNLPETDTQRMFTSMWIIIGIAATSNLIGVISAIVSEEAKRKKLDLRNALARKKLNQNDVIDDDLIDQHEQGLELTRVAKIMNAKARRIFNVVTFHDTYVEMLKESSNVHDKIANLRLSYAEELQDMRYQIFLDSCMLILIVLSATLFMAHEEHWTMRSAFYWSVVTVSTVGYGDFVPTHDGTKLFTCLYVLFGGFFFLKVVTGSVAVPIKMLSLKNEIRVIRQFEVNLTEERFTHIVTHPIFVANPRLRRKNNELNKGEFVIALLNMMNKLRDEDVAIASDIFDAIDISGDGVLSREDLEQYRHTKPLLSVKIQDGLQRQNDDDDDDDGLSIPLFHVLRGVLKAKSAFIKRRVAAEPLSHSERLPTIIEPPKVFQQQAEQSTEIHPFVDPET